ncbi:hypothetical protein NPIL_694931, partial [Nephila pilipes]
RPCSSALSAPPETTPRQAIDRLNVPLSLPMRVLSRTGRTRTSSRSTAQSLLSVGTALPLPQMVVRGSRVILQSNIKSTHLKVSWKNKHPLLLLPV